MIRKRDRDRRVTVASGQRDRRVHPASTQRDLPWPSMTLHDRPTKNERPLPSSQK